MDRDDNYIYCILCDYKAPRNRTDNFERHMQSKHYDNSVECVCGAKMRRTSLKRHKENSCPSFSRNIDINQNDSKANSFTSSIQVNKSDLNAPAELVSIVEHKIETTVRVKTYSNGTVVFDHDKINAGKYSFILKNESNDADALTSYSRTGKLKNMKSMKQQPLSVLHLN